MKALKLLSAGLLASVLVGSALADTTTTIKITGSSAFRKATVTAVVGVLNQANVYALYDGANLTGANYCTIIGDLATDSTKHYIVQCVWNGSAHGIEILDQPDLANQTLCGTTNNVWISGPVAAPWNGTNTVWAARGLAACLVTHAVTHEVVTAGAGVNAAEKATGGFYDPAATAQVAMSDVFQASTPFHKVALVEVHTVAKPHVGVVDFLWVKGIGCSTYACNWNSFKNMTWEAANNLFATGAIPLSMVTGRCDDDNLTVNLTGRDPDSGTRITAEVEALYSLGLNVFQFQPQPQPLGSATTLDAGPCTETPWPATPFCTPFKALPAGGSGFSSGGTLAGYMKVPVDCCAGDFYRGLPYIYVTYLGRNDAVTASSDGSRWLSYNGAWYFANLANYPANFNVVDPCNVACAGLLAGQPNALGFCPLTRGQYTFWAYEHMYIRPDLTDADTLTLVNRTFANLTTLDAASTVIDATLSGILLDDMLVTKSKDGAVPVTTLF